MYSSRKCTSSRRPGAAIAKMQPQIHAAMSIVLFRDNSSTYASREDMNAYKSRAGVPIASDHQSMWCLGYCHVPEIHAAKLC